MVNLEREKSFYNDTWNKIWKQNLYGLCYIGRFDNTFSKAFILFSLEKILSSNIFITGYLLGNQ